MHVYWTSDLFVILFALAASGATIAVASEWAADRRQHDEKVQR